MNSWKTTAAGVGVLATAVATLANAFATGDYSHLPDAIGMVFGALGLGLAKDFNVTNAAPSTQAPAAPVK
jgi:hypothetical protein